MHKRANVMAVIKAEKDPAFIEMQRLHALAGDADKLRSEAESSCGSGASSVEVSCGTRFKLLAPRSAALRCRQTRGAAKARRARTTWRFLLLGSTRHGLDSQPQPLQWRRGHRQCQQQCPPPQQRDGQLATGPTRRRRIRRQREQAVAFADASATAPTDDSEVTRIEMA